VVTDGSALLLARTLPPFGDSLYCAQKYKTKPKVHKHSEIHVGRGVTGRRGKIGHQQKIDYVPRQDGNQGLNEVHSSF
jgi:hypothetical protein